MEQKNKENKCIDCKYGQKCKNTLPSPEYFIHCKKRGYPMYIESTDRHCKKTNNGVSMFEPK